jgi:uncharacterized membrane protein YeaQ/YmgE (transglycosylase-associated protein family)
MADFVVRTEPSHLDYPTFLESLKDRRIANCSLLVRLKNAVLNCIIWFLNNRECQVTRVLLLSSKTMKCYVLTGWMANKTRGLFASVAGGAGGAFLGNKLMHGKMGKIMGGATGAVIANVLESKFKNNHHHSNQPSFSGGLLGGLVVSLP